MSQDSKRLFRFSLVSAASLWFYYELLASWAIKFIPFKGSFPYWESVLAKAAPDWLWFWGNFDGVHYLNIAHVGYQYGLTQAFFPVYPLLIKYLGLLLTNPLATGLIISLASLAGFLYFFIKLGLLDYPQDKIRWAVILLLTFPTAFFFFAIYTESLFFFLSAAALYLARKKKFFYSVIFAGVASATKLVGIFLLPAILIEYWRTVKKSNWPKAASLSLLGSSGLLLYLGYLGKHFGDFLIFIHSQPGFGAGRQVDKIIMPYQVTARYFKMFLGVSPGNEIYPVLVFEFLISLLFFGLIIWAAYKKFRLSYLAFIVPSLLLPTFTGSFSSMPRYALAGFPLFFFLAAKLNRKARLVTAVIFLSLSAWAFIRFARGYWVA
ncbi:MAG: hypothetical protein UX85_C0005G0012 [Candidatus Beckwithbacteria bacterium GW2011_GWB1_47_15]|uniref:Glycosyltransferase RgtA/B/C/D-like domain-containing protein n=1 Tax=Candidatus Beckwithbacteria bacterium GW2011_GWB1_47_15 TaxID=1618371 RepID=A0A0G1RUH5_9BACT|nr:MAG: hypothetical protein UY43_C0001G0742 [Candidatus Beckwithbacteria bacterium GW2011_GWC1_49_16]KKU35720.1 MAG: hypothetical protein UX50_C0002G0147 [Candidatus Beckwithbacteria bacterium GW2011_GWA1_46_30]KKU60974.1 MAG: hypothetical protein UX85_C0005G0012 [Candidatus Beckwithbacteria bacterium GW2011_GWB1_47_15]KKU72279.1 MAG: hypothetical protein UX97_C0001G0149 [Candidatus Beckwithbacteria bacterium GW2011_GWA2_47_25]KKW04961.1 MAG: hypothetical protein UY37_C0001G0065 [Candidatus Be